jgi:hypothetical protein
MPTSTTLPHDPGRQTYALRLRAPVHDPTDLRGEIEHVLSGERERFDSPASLLAALERLQCLVMRAQAGQGETGPGV